MNTLRTRLARLAAASVLALGLGALAAGPALADKFVEVNDSVTLAVDDDASTDGIGRPGGVHSVEDGAATDSYDFTGDPTDGDQSTNGNINAI